MYEGETMAQILKRTKKCCVKLFRKFSFNTSSTTNIPIRIRSQSARYVQQKNRTPVHTQDIPSPQNSCGSWRFDRSGKIIAEGASPDDLSGDEEDYQMFHISPKFFTKGNAAYLRVENKSKKTCGTPKTQSHHQQQSNPMAVIWRNGYVEKARKSFMNEKVSSSSFDDENILFTENKIYIGEGAESGEVEKSRKIEKTISNSSINMRRNEILSRPTICEGSCCCRTCDTTRTTTPLSTTTTTTTSFIVTQNLFDQFDSCLSLAASNLRNNLTPKRFSYCNNKNCQDIDSGCEMTRYRTQSNEEVFSQRDDFGSRCSAAPLFGSNNCEEVVFEKVKYDRNKKYLRHTPSSSSAGSAASSPPKSSVEATIQALNSTHSIYTFENSGNDSILTSSKPNTPPKKWERPSSSLYEYDHLRWSCTNGVDSDEMDEEDDDYEEDDDDDDEDDEDINGNLQSPEMIREEYKNRINEINQKCPTPWDDNGNNANEYTKILYDDPWDVFDNKVNRARDKRILQLRRDDDSIRTSPKSSSTTLETWVDDEVFDNSFNEELERRNSTLGR